MMKNILKFGVLVLLAFACSSSSAQIKIGDNATAVDARSILELETTTKAIYLPRLTTTQRDAQVGWKAGMFIYNSTLNCVQFFDGTTWVCLAATPGTPDLDADPTNEIQMLSLSNDTLYLSDGNNVYLGGLMSDLDQDSTNEYNTAFAIIGDSLVITDLGTRYAVAVGSILDTASLSNRIDVNLQAIIDSVTNVRSELADSADVIRTLIENHIAADLDTDETNEYNTGFEMNGTGDSLVITDLGTRYAVAVGSILDTASLSNRIDVNLQAIIDSVTNVRSELADSADVIRTLIEAHIALDLDTDETNEYNTGFTMNGTGDSLVITDLGTRYAVAVGSILDTASLSNRIDVNLQAIIDSVTNVRGELADSSSTLRTVINDSAAVIRTLVENHIAADLDTDETNEYNTGFEMNGTGDSLVITDLGTRYAVAVGSILDTASLSNRIDVNLQAIIDSVTNVRSELADSSSTLRTVINDSAAVIRTLIENHIAADLDTDETNEYNTGFEMNGTGDSLVVTDLGTRYAVAVGDVLDTASLSNRIDINLQAIIDSITNVRGELSDSSTTLRMTISDSAAVIRTLIENHIAADLDTDETNEYNTGFEMNGTGDSLVITDLGTRYAVAVGSILDTASLSNRIDVNLQAIIDSVTNVRSELADSSSTLRTVINDSAAVIRTLIENHIAADLDTDETNEYNTGFEMNGTGDSLVVTDLGTRYAVAVGSILDTASLSNRIDVNLQAIIDSVTNVRGELADTASTLRIVISDSAAVIRTLIENHIAADLDTDETNEYNTGFTMNGTGDSLVITDLGTRYAVAVGDVLDTASLSNRIDVNLQAIIDSVTNVRGNLSDTSTLLRTLLQAHIAADTDTDPTNEQNTAFAVVGTDLRITDAGGNLDVPLSDIIDTTSLSDRINNNAQGIIDSSADIRSALIDTAAALRADMATNSGLIDTAAAIRSALVDTAADLRMLINDHITLDEDTDSTNELITAVAVTGDSLKITEAGTDWSVFIEDMDSTNELVDSMRYVGDSLYIYEGGDSIAAYIPKGEWEDGDSISIAGLVYAKQALANGDTLVITDNAQIGVGLSVPTEDIDVANTIRLRNVDTTSLSDTMLVLDSTGVVKKMAFGDALHNMIEMYDATGGQLIDTNGQRVKFATLEFADSYYENTDSSITVKKAGRYKITYRVTIEMTGSNNRSTVEHFLLRNDVEIPGSFAGTYHRNATSNTTTGTVVKTVQLDVDDIIKLNSLQVTGIGELATKANGSSIMIEYIKP